MNDVPQVIASEQSKPTATPPEEFLFARGELYDTLIKVAREHLFHDNLIEARATCLAAYLAQLPKENAARRYAHFEDFWWSFKTVALANRIVGPTGGASA